MKIYATLFCLLLSVHVAFCQELNGELYNIDLSSSLPYVILFYVVTFVSLGLYLIKLVRPNHSNKWLYVSCVIGIIGGAVLSMQFDNIQKEQLPKLEYENLKEEELEPQLREQFKINKRDVENQKYANFWIISMPNFIILGLGILADYKNRKRDLSKPRGRYD